MCTCQPGRPECEDCAAAIDRAEYEREHPDYPEGPRR